MKRPLFNNDHTRIKELEDINDMHRRLNGELRECITDLEKSLLELEISLNLHKAALNNCYAR